MKESIINDILRDYPKNGGKLILATLGKHKEISLTMLFEMSGCVANGLLAIGLKAGDSIGILSVNCLEWILLDLACLRIKVRTYGFDPEKFEASSTLIENYQLKLLFSDQKLDKGQRGLLRDIKEVNNFLADFPEKLPSVQYEAEETTTVKFTSGSTGIPKGLAATVGSIDSSLRDIQKIFDHNKSDRLLVFLPLSLLQQRYWIYSALKYGHDIVLTNYQSVFIAMPLYQPTVVMGVPAFFDAAKRYIEQLSNQPNQLSSQTRAVFGNNIRYLWTGSAPARISTLRFFNQLNIPIFEGYGMNETCIVSKNHPGAHRVGSVGKVLDEKKIIIDEDGNIIVRSDFPVNRSYQYAKSGVSKKIFIRDGYVRTGDFGYLDEDGYLFIKGRTDDVIVLDNGKKIDIQPIEARLRDNPSIADCIIFSKKQTELIAIISPTSVKNHKKEIHSAVKMANNLSEKDEFISRFIITDQPFSIENGLLTSQFKPIRKLILERYKNKIN